MVSFLKDKWAKMLSKLAGSEKKDAEVRFWKNEIQNYIRWYEGKIQELYGNPVPAEKVNAYTKELSAILTFFETHQKKKYLKDLMLEKNAFETMKLLDIGSGPFPNALCFSGCEVYNLDPLFDRYIGAGYPIHCYESRARFVHAKAESIPFENHFFGAVISVNAIDHVDDFQKTAIEIKRVLKPGGKFRMHVHYHLKTTTEPIELNDEIFLKHYSWVNGLKKIQESKEKTGTFLENLQEMYVVWGN